MQSTTPLRNTMVLNCLVEKGDGGGMKNCAQNREYCSVLQVQLVYMVVMSDLVYSQHQLVLSSYCWQVAPLRIPIDECLLWFLHRNLIILSG